MATAANARSRNPWLVLVFLSLGFFMILLDTTIVNIAIPSLISDLHSSLDQILWVLNAYLLVYAVLLITCGRLGDLVGPRRMFIIGLVIFTAASALCGLAQDGNQLIAARILQGVGGAILTPQTLSIITVIFPPERRGAAFGLWGAVAGVAAITGPTLGGFLVTDVNWRWIFYVNVPVGIVALLGAIFIVPDLRPGRHHRFDLIGVALASAGLFGIVFGLVEGQRYDWGTIWGVITIPEIIAAGLVLMVVFVLFERIQPEPLLPLSLFANRNFSIAIWVSAVVAFGMLGFFLPLTIFLQSVLGFSALKAGLTFLPMSLISMVVAPVAGRMTDRFGGKWILLAGLTCFASGMGLVVFLVSLNATQATFWGPAAIAGIGMGMTFAPLTTVAMRDMRPQMAGAASGVLNTVRQLGGAIGSAVIGAVLQNRLATELHDQALAYADKVPPAFRGRFIDGFTHAASSGFQVGVGQTGGAQLPPNVPAAVVHSLQALFHEVFANAYVNAVRPTLVVSITVLGVGALSCLFIEGRAKAAARADHVERRQTAIG
ncbi:MAG TPA: DHA2 family efflux MFS transporter permease subunit [Candidatus Limnocylindrales bacterium]|nr:DHA2 family efflux MFS transporter permease subunit [Candidatus Limnocylindrales bacterium]